MLVPRYLWPALDTLFQHRLRSLLTVLGIAIGITATVIMMALGRGMQRTINQQFTLTGVTHLLVQGRPPPDADAASTVTTSIPCAGRTTTRWQPQGPFPASGHCCRWPEPERPRAFRAKNCG